MSATGAYFARMLEKHIADTEPRAHLQDADTSRRDFAIDVVTDEGKVYLVTVNEVG